MIRKLFILGLAALLVFMPGLGAQALFMEDQDPVSPDLEAMYVRGLNFLARTQQESGSWSDSYGSNPGVVGLAVLAMLAHGDDPNFGDYHEPIRKGLDFLLSKANPENGYIGSSMYNHGFATLALAEAYGAVNDERLGPALKKAADFLLSVQADNPRGAWRYGPASRDADTTVAGACLLALFAARNAGIGVPDEAVEKALAFYRSCQSPDGGFGYTGPGGSNLPRTAIGTLMFALAKKQKTPVFKAALSVLTGGVFRPDGSYHYYYLYYAAQAYFHGAPEKWNEWNNANIASLRGTQLSSGAWQDNFGPAFCTSAALLSLALNYRFLPVYER